VNRSAIRYITYIFILVALCVWMAYAIIEGQYGTVILAFCLSLYPIFALVKHYQFLLQQIEDFSQAVHYRDFTRQYKTTAYPSAQNQLYTSFNTINQVFRQISGEREMQYEYLHRVINLLDSAILFYQVDSGKVIWTNDAFKQLFSSPHLGSIGGMQKRNPELYQKTMALSAGLQKMDTVSSAQGLIKVLMHSSEYETKEGKFRMVVYQNIHDAVDQTETEAWQKLLRVLTHEIMNSIGPISSLADTLHQRMLQMPSLPESEDLREGIFTIKRRSEGLIQFANSYRLINRVDQPNFQEIQVLQLFENVNLLLEPTLLKREIELDLILKNTRQNVYADNSLIEQILINLLLNAMDAVKEVPSPSISLTALEKEQKCLIQVRDNGTGMSKEIQEQIFTPFFTTKKTGTGVGLTLSKQIMLLHKGQLWVESTVGKGSVFTLVFPLKS
jgi:two-component system nitrogen regulation sensor histidine kinase NtrY